MLVGSKVVLRAPVEADVAFLFALRNDIDLQMQLMTLPRANSRRLVEEWLTRLASDPASVFFVIAEKTENNAIGFVQLVRMDFVHGHGDLGICLGEAARGKGQATEALRLFEDYVAAVFRIRKILLSVFDSNRPAIKLYEKDGFQTVGVLRRHFYQKSAYHDVRLMEKLLSDRE